MELDRVLWFLHAVVGLHKEQAQAMLSEGGLGIGYSQVMVLGPSDGGQLSSPGVLSLPTWSISKREGSTSMRSPGLSNVKRIVVGYSHPAPGYVTRR